MSRGLVRLFSGVSAAVVALVTAGPALACFSPPPCGGLTISTKAVSAATTGQPVYDTATLQDGSRLDGSISWKVYRSSDRWCSDALYTTAAVPVQSGKTTYDSPTLTPAPGSYQWVATYTDRSGSVSSPCNDSSEQTVVSKASPTLATTASSTTAGGAIRDSAVVSGGDSPGGSITWAVYVGPNCTSPVFTSTAVAVNGDGTYLSPSYTPTSAGTYQWVATYSGDANNNSYKSSCSDPNEQSVVSKGAPALSTTASQGTVGGAIRDTAVLSGGDSPSGSITWTVYSLSDASCAAPLWTSSPVTVSGDNTYYSPYYTPSGAGTYQWVANYSGDANNGAVKSPCTDTSERSVVSKTAPTIVTTASSTSVGGSIDDTAVLSGGDSPGGSITWSVYSLTDTSCTSPLFTTSAVPVSGDSTYVSPSFTPTSAGTYQWVATYSGDANNTAVSSPCTDTSEQSVVSKVAPAISTTASSGTLGQPIHDQAVLSGGDSPSGSLTWSLYSVADTSCSTPLYTSSAVPVSGDGTYNSPDYTPTSAGTYQWVASYSGDANDSGLTSACNVAAEQSVVQTPPPPPTPPTPGISVVKLQRDGSTGPFTTGTITANVGDTIEYEIQVTNTGNTTLALSLNDPLCNAGTVMGPYAISGTITGGVLSAGGKAQYTCSHVLTGSDPSPFTNTATVTGQPPSGPPVQGTASVTANKQAVAPVKIVRCRHGKVKKHKKVHGKWVTVCVAKKKVSAASRRREPAPTFTG